jgi:hypothetical protein
MKGLKYMNNVLFRRGDQTFIDENVPLNDGQIIFNETDEAIYVDNTINGSVVRKRYGGGNLSRSDIDSALSTTSENPVQNKIITARINSLDASVDTINTKLHQVSNSNDAYSTTKAYSVGDLCIYNNILYRCITACSAGSWATNQSCFTADTLTHALGTKISTPNNNNFKLYFPNNWTNFYLRTEWLSNINVSANGDASRAITFDIPNVSELFLPKIFLTPYTEGGVWAYVSCMVSGLTRTGCSINIHNYENSARTVSIAILIMY